jgi:predicted AAA+ superfamily ATPase
MKITLRSTEPLNRIPSAKFITAVLAGSPVKNEVQIPYLVKIITFHVVECQDKQDLFSKNTEYSVQIYWDYYYGLLIPKKSEWKRFFVDFSSITNFFVGQDCLLQEISSFYEQISRSVDSNSPCGKIANLIGVSGSGKTFLADLLAQHFPNIARIDSINLKDCLSTLNALTKTSNPMLLFVENFDQNLFQDDFESAESKFHHQFVFWMQKLVETSPIGIIFTSETRLKQLSCFNVPFEGNFFLNWSSSGQAASLLKHFGQYSNLKLTEALRGFFPCEVNYILIQLSLPSDKSQMQIIQQNLPSRLVPITKIRQIFRSSFVGMQKEKQEVNLLLQNFVRGISLTKGIIFYGDTGCGKSMFASAIVNEFSASNCLYFLSIDASQVRSKFIGNSEKELIRLFTRAKSFPKSCILIDQMDSLFSARNSSSSNRLVNVLLKELDECSNAFVIGITKNLSSVDEALLRPGRLYPHFEFKQMSLEERREFFEQKMKSIPLLLSEEELHKLLDLTSGFNGAELENAVQKAALYALNQTKLEAKSIFFQHFIF